MSRDARTDNWIVSATYTVPLASGYALALITAMTVGEHTLTRPSASTPSRPRSGPRSRA